MDTNNSYEFFLNNMQINCIDDFDKLDWSSISSFRYLSEDFMAKHRDLINWNIASTVQRFSPSFVYKMSEYINWRAFTNCQLAKYPLEMIIFFKHKIDHERFNKINKPFKNLSLNWHLIEYHFRRQLKTNVKDDMMCEYVARYLKNEAYHYEIFPNKEWA